MSIVAYWEYRALLIAVAKVFYLWVKMGSVSRPNGITAELLYA